MADLGDAVAVLRQLRQGPVTIAQIVEATKLGQDKVYRLIAALEAAGATIERGEVSRPDGGRPAATLRLTAAAMKRWIG